MARIDPQSFRGNLKTLVNRCRERNRKVVLCTPNAVINTSSRPIDKLKTYCEIIREVAREPSVSLCGPVRSRHNGSVLEPLGHGG